LSEARDAAREALNDAGREINPNEEKKRRLEALKRQQADGIAAVSDLFIERYAKKRGNKTWRQTQRILERFVIPRWGNRPISEISKTDVVQLLDYVEDHHGFYMANRTLAAVRKMFNWALDERGLIEATPIGRKMARGRELPRGRTLSDDEIRAIWDGCSRLGYPFGQMLKLLLLTGQRRSEVAEMQWSELDLDQSIWIIPGERTKNEEEHVVPLSAEVMAVIEALPRFEGPYVFSTTVGHRPVSGFSTFKRRADKLTGITDWRLHDLRRTCRTGLAALNVPEIVSEKLLNHQTDKLVQTYNRHDYLEEKRAALDRWARQVMNAISRPSENIIHLEAH
jgi:integrase